MSYCKQVKHFGVILLCYITFCTALYFTTYKGHISSHIYYIWQHEIPFFFSSNNACFPLINAHRSPADLTHLTAERKAARSILEAGPIFTFALQTARSFRGSDEHVKCRSFRLQCRRCEIYQVSFSTFVLKIYNLMKNVFLFLFSFF